MEKISPKSVKDIEKSRFWSRSRDFCQFLEGFGFGFGEFGLGKKVSVLVSEDLVSEKNYGFRLQRIWSRKKNQFRKIWYRKKSFALEKFGIGRKVSVLVSVKILVLSFSGFGVETLKETENIYIW